MLYSCNSQPNDPPVSFGAADLSYDRTASIEVTTSNSSGYMLYKAEATPTHYEPIIQNQPDASKKKIIKDGNIAVETRDINTGKQNIDQLVKGLNAYYEREDLQNNEQGVSYDLKIRVPAENFEKLITGIESGADEVKSKSIQARDVTEEYMDIETRLANKREYLKRYKELLSKAGTVKDVLAIEENIRALQEEIESKEGRLKYLSDQISFSTLEFRLYQKKEFVYKPQDKFTERVKTSLSNGWTSVVNFILWTIRVWPVILLVAALIFTIRRVIIKRRARRQSK